MTTKAKLLSGLSASLDQTGKVPSSNMGDSIALTGTPSSPTAAVGTNSTQLATTAFVVAALRVPSSTVPAALGVAAIGVGLTFARADHVHLIPTLATLGAQASGTYATGTGSASGTNTGDQTLPVASSTNPAALGVAAVGVGTTFARADHVHLIPTLATLGAQAAGSYLTAEADTLATVTGRGASSSTNITLSGGTTNLGHATTNYITTSDNGSIIIKTKDQTAVNGALLNLQTGNTTAVGSWTGGILIKTGNATGGSNAYAGDISMYPGSSDGVGALTVVSAGDSYGGTTSVGGYVKIKGGSSTTTTGTTLATGGSVYIYGGDVTSANNFTKSTGSVYIEGGGASGLGTITFGTVNIGNTSGNSSYGTSAINLGNSLITTTINGTVKLPNVGTSGFVKLGAGGILSADTTTYATGTGSASGTNTGDETTATIKTKLSITTLSGSNTGDQTLPTALPNANAITFNSTGGAAAGSTYTGAAILTVDYSTVGAAPSGHTHSYQAADNDLLAIGGLTGTSGYLKKTAADTWTLDTSTFSTGGGTASGTNTGDNPGVTSVTGTAPVVSSGGTTPAISMAAATTSVAGYLTAVDWTTFNSKQPAGSYLTDAMRDRGAVATATVDTAILSGYYRQDNVGDSHALLVFNAAGSTSIVQQRFHYSGSMEFRNKTDATTWQPWKTVVTSSNIGTYGVSSVAATGPIVTSAAAGAITLSHAASGVTAGTYNNLTVNATGHATAGSNVAYYHSGNVPPYPAEADTLATVTARGNTTTTSIQASNLNPAYTVSDFDAIKAPGLYQYDGAMTSTPNSDANYRTIEIGSSTRYSQIALNYSSDGMWFRRRTDAVWSTWRQVWHSGNLTNLNQLTNGPGYGTGTVTAVTATTPIISSGGTTPNITHATSGATAGTYNNVTVNTFGHVTAGSNTGYLTALTDTLATVTARGNVATGSIVIPSGSANAYRFWGSGNNEYAIRMGNDAEFHYGPVIDYSIKSTIDSVSSTRGFTWGVNGATPIAALNVGNGNMQIAGTFSALSKSFLIDHPTKPGMQLRYGSLEGPENGVYIRGRLKGNKIELPEYWTKLVDPDSITVNLTAIGKSQDIYIEDIIDNVVYVGGENVNCFYTVYAERVDIAKLEVEIA